MNEVRRRFYGVCAVAAAAVNLASPIRIGVACGTSMEPTFKNGSIYLMDRGYYQQRPVSRGDVVVFRHDGESHIKRVIALEGDHVFLIRQPGCDFGEVAMDWQVPKLRRVLENPAYRVSIKLVRLEVPEGHCFVLGENMIASLDSRHYGTVPLSSIQGRVLRAPAAHPLMEHVAVNPAGGTASS